MLLLRSSQKYSVVCMPLVSLRPFERFCKIKTVCVTGTTFAFLTVLTVDTDDEKAMVDKTGVILLQIKTMAPHCSA